MRMRTRDVIRGDPNGDASTIARRYSRVDWLLYGMCPCRIGTWPGTVSRCYYGIIACQHLTLALAPRMLVAATVRRRLPCSPSMLCLSQRVARVSPLELDGQK